jgi:hypothetical protein
MTMSGYTGTPLARKLGIQSGTRLYARHAPADYLQLLEPLPEGARILQRPSGHLDLVHLFARDTRSLAAELSDYRRRIGQDGMIWVSWPKKSSKVKTDITEDVIRELALPLGLVDTKVCAVDDTWSGLKLVIRLKHRKE